MSRTGVGQVIRIPTSGGAAAATHGAGARLTVLAGTVPASSSDSYVCMFHSLADGDWDTDAYFDDAGTRLWTVPAGFAGVYNLELYSVIPAATKPTAGFVTVGFLLPDAPSVSLRHNFTDFTGSAGNFSSRMSVSLTTTLHVADAIDIFVENGTDQTIISGFTQGSARFSGWLLVPEADIPPDPE